MGRHSDGLPRGIPAASLKPHYLCAGDERTGVSSAGNTRGLIEAGTATLTPISTSVSSAGNTRGLIEARDTDSRRPGCSWGLPRGIPAASLKPRPAATAGRRTRVFRGEYPRPH